MATTTAKPETLIGKRIRRREDPRLITGTATYVDDIKMPGMHFAAILFHKLVRNDGIFETMAPTLLSHPPKE